jgi:membrane-associated protein
VLARFVPIVRTSAPFVAGVGRMDYRRFLAFSITGALLWVGLLVLAGYLFGQLPMVQDNFALVVVAIIGLSLTPLAVEYLRARLRG